MTETREKFSMTELKSFDNEAYIKGPEEDNNANQVQKSTKAEFSNLSEEERKKAKRGIIINVVTISFAFMLLFTAFQSMANLQSSINKVNDLSTSERTVQSESLWTETFPERSEVEQSET